MGHKIQNVLLTLIGGAVLLAGLICAFLGPVELYVFYMFSPGGQFYYEGFGFGSFMFGNVASQIAGYYLIAFVFIPLGYGHLVRRRWARTLAEDLLWFWMVMGVPLLIVFLLVLFSAKEFSMATGLVIAIGVALSYPLLPLLLLRFYRSEGVRRIFESRDPHSNWLEERPMHVLVLGSLSAFYCLALHVPILFNGLFPVFGAWLSGLTGIVALTAAILALVLLTWGVFGQKLWAWWGAVIYFALLMVSTVVTLATSSWFGLLDVMNLPAYEVGFLEGVPALGWHFAVFFGLPLLVTWGLFVASKRCFGRDALAALHPFEGTEPDGQA